MHPHGIKTPSTVQFCFLDEPFAQTGFQTFLQHFFRTAFCQSLAPAGHCRLIRRIVVLKIRSTGKILPIRIFKPFVKNGFVAHAAGVFQIMQRNHQTHRTRGASIICAKTFLQTIFEALPINRIRKLHHRMPFRNDITQQGLE